MSSPAASSVARLFIALVLTALGLFAPGVVAPGVAAPGVAAQGASAEPSLDAKLWAELARPATLSARFTQVQHRAILKVPLTSTGHLHYERAGGALVWAVDAPARSTFSLRGSVATLEQPDLGLSETFDLAAVPDANRIATSMMVWLKADPAAVERDFRVSYGARAVTLAPRDPTLAGLLSEIQIAVAPSPWRVSAVTLVEPDADRVEIAFHDVVLDGRPVPNP